MNELKYITLDRLMDILQSYKGNFGGNIPILLSDKDSPNSLTNLVGTYVIDILDSETDESQVVILLCNMEKNELVNDPGFDFEEDCEEDCNDEPEEVFYEDD